MTGRVKTKLGSPRYGECCVGAESTEFKAIDTSFVFSRKDEQHTVTLQSVEDDVVEHDEEYKMNFYAPGAVLYLFIKMRNDDQATITVSDARVDEGGMLTFTATPTFSGLSAADYTANTASLIFEGKVGEVKTFTVPTTQDAVAEADETFTVGLSVSPGVAPWSYFDGQFRPGGAFRIVAGTGTIVDDDPVFVSIYDPEGSVTEGSSVQLPVRLTLSVNGTVNVPWTTGDDSGGGASGHEYSPSSGTVTFAPGQTEATIEINILDDQDHENLESFQITLGAPLVSGSTSRQVLVGRATAEVTITDNDALCPAGLPLRR